MRSLAMQRYIAVLATATALLAAACDSAITDTGQPAPRDAVALGAKTVFERQTGWSGYDTPTRTLITTRAAWSAAWAKLHAHVAPVPPLPEIDFSTSVLVLVAMGTRPTSGYAVTIREVSAHSGTLYVNVLERVPGPTCGTFQALTAPVHIVEVPRHGVSAVFAIANETYGC